MVNDNTGSGRGGRRSFGRRTIAVLPTLLTLGNLLCGFVAVFMASRPHEPNLPWNWTPLTFAAIFVFFGMVFDGLDGRVARMTRSTSDLGEQLDSMADMVTFGVAPAFIAVQLITRQLAASDNALPFIGVQDDTLVSRFVLALAGIYVACTALRLARFNIELENPDSDTDDHMWFSGLPSPGAAGTVAAMVLLHEHLGINRESGHWSIVASSVGMVLLMGVTAWSMVSNIRYPHIINRYVRGRAHFHTLIMLVVIILLAVTWLQLSLAIAFGSYSLLVPLVALYRKIRGDRSKPEPEPAPTVDDDEAHEPSMSQHSDRF